MSPLPRREPSSRARRPSFEPLSIRSRVYFFEKDGEEEEIAVVPWFAKPPPCCVLPSPAYSRPVRSQYRVMPSPQASTAAVAGQGTPVDAAATRSGGAYTASNRCPCGKSFPTNCRSFGTGTNERRFSRGGKCGVGCTNCTYSRCIRELFCWVCGTGKVKCLS